MEAKDWTMILVPLLVDGIVLFIFQQLWSSHYQKKQEIKRKQDHILSLFIANMGDFLSAFRLLPSAYTDPNNMLPFSVVWNPASDQMQKLVAFFENHLHSLGKFEDSFKKICEQWDIMVNLIAKYKAQHGTYDSNFRAEFKCEYDKLHIMLTQCLTEAEKESLTF